MVDQLIEVILWMKSIAMLFEVVRSRPDFLGIATPFGFAHERLVVLQWRNLVDGLHMSIEVVSGTEALVLRGACGVLAFVWLFMSELVFSEKSAGST